jgi:RecA/RadA recombinase
MAKNTKIKGEFSFDDLNKELAKTSSLGSVMELSEFSEIDQYIHSGNYHLNACLTGSLFKGYPSNRSIAVAGPSGTGKTYLILNAVKNFQEQGYYPIYVDSENAVDRELMERFKIDTSKVRYEPIGTVEEFRTIVTSTCQTLIDAKRAGYEIPKILFILDSAGNLASKKEVDDAISGSDKADMTRSKKMKSIFRIIMNKMAEIKATFIFSNHVYMTQDFYPEAKAGGGSGPEYAASIILYLTKAKMKEVKKVDGKKVTEQTGIIVTARPNKNRFAKPTTIKFQIPFNKAANPFVGLENYISWETCGIQKGYLYTEKEFNKLKDKEKEGLIEFPYIDTESGEVLTKYFEPSESSNKIIVKHLGRAIGAGEFFTSSVFTEDVLKSINEHITPIFNYGIEDSSADDFDIESIETEDDSE